MVVLVARRVQQGLGRPHLGVGGVDLLVEPAEGLVELLELGSALGQSGLLRPQLGELLVVDPLALGFGLAFELLAFEIAELGLIPLPGLGVVLEHHPDRDPQQCQRAQREHHVETSEVVVAIGLLVGWLRHHALVRY